MSKVSMLTADSAGVTAINDSGVDSSDRRLNLLRKIAAAGGAISPTAEPRAEHGYAFVALGADVERDLDILTRRDYLEKRFFDRVSVCPKCDSHYLNVREICPCCRRAHLSKEGLLHHFRCGYVGIPSEFAPTKDDGYVCPKCNGKMHHLGSEYDRLGKAFTCRGCGHISENPPVEASCFACSARTAAEDLVSKDVFSYVLTSRGAAANRSGTLHDDEEELVSIAAAPVYRRTVVLEFLDHEIKRLQHFKSVFSLLLAKWAPASTDQSDDLSLSQCLTRLRQCLPEVYPIGQLADALYVVILPQTRLRAAESLSHNIVAELGRQSPLTLSAFEITEARHLAAALGSLGPRVGSS